MEMHSKNVVALLEQVRKLLTGDGFCLVCDHYCGAGGMSNDQLFMTVDKQVLPWLRRDSPLKYWEKLLIHQAAMKLNCAQASDNS